MISSKKILTAAVIFCMMICGGALTAQAAEVAPAGDTAAAVAAAPSGVGDTCTVTLKYDNMEQSFEVESGSPLDFTNSPGTKSGKLFAGWFTDEECTTLFNFGTEITQDTTLYGKWADYSNQVGAQAVLGERIEYYFQIEFDKILENTQLDTNFTMLIDGEPLDGEEVKVSELDAVYTDDSVIKTFSVSLPARMMGKSVDYLMTTRYSDNKHTFSAGSVYQYLDYIMNSTETDSEGNPLYPDEAKALAEATYIYGEQAAAYFDNTITTMVVPEIDFDSLNIDPVLSGELPEGLNYKGSTLILQSRTAVRHYFTVDDGHKMSDYSFDAQYDDDNIQVTSGKVDDSNYYYIEFGNIDAEKLGETFDLDIDDFTISYSALSYAKIVHINLPESEYKLKRAMSALVNYNKKAVAYAIYLKQQEGGSSVLG